MTRPGSECRHPSLHSQRNWTASLPAVQVRGREVAASYGKLSAASESLLCVRISADNERMRSLCCSVIAGLGIALSACNNPMLLVDVEIDFLPMGTTQLFGGHDRQRPAGTRAAPVP